MRDIGKKRKTVREKAVEVMISAIKASLRLFGEERRVSISARIIEKLAPVVNVGTSAGTLKLYCPGEIALWRAKTFLTKEPETIEWINGFDKNCVFWDIGANVGVYSLYAALRSDIKVLAFEPSVLNLEVLIKNIRINKMEDSISPLNVAFTSSTSLDYLYMQNTEVGGALHRFGMTAGWNGKAFVHCFKQRIIGLSIDDFIEKFSPSFPDYIKIDVDGAENEIIIGAKNTFADKRLKSILIELNDEDSKGCNEVIDFFTKMGFRLYARKNTAVFKGDELSPAGNHIFKRIK